jgi:AcrR family transcriptional regulator
MALVDSVVELMLRGIAHPTSQQVAEAADVSVRTLYNHFKMDGLRDEAIASTFSTLASSVVRLPSRGPLSIRIAAVCHQRRELFAPVEKVLASVRTVVAAPPPLADAVDDLRRRLRAGIETVFESELAARGKLARSYLDHLDSITGWECWTSLRFTQRFSATEAERTMAMLITHVLT